MSKKTLLLVAAGTAALTLASGNAATVALNANPGLWQVTTRSQMSGQMPMDESALKNLSSAQRAKFEAAMQGVMARAAAPHVFKECLTQEKLAKGFEVEKQETGCVRTIVSSSANALEVREHCTGADGIRNGDFKFVVVNGTSSTGSVSMQMSKGGKTMTINGTMQGQWLGASCQGIKDIQMVKPAALPAIH